MSQHRKPSKEAEAREREEMRIGFRMMGLAWLMVTEVLAGAGIGWIVDHYAGTAPNGMMTGAIIGIVVSMYSLIRGGLSMNAYLEGRGAPLEHRVKQAKHSKAAADAARASSTDVRNDAKGDGDA